MHPILRYLDSLNESAGSPRGFQRWLQRLAFADDIGQCIREIQQLLPLLPKAFELIRSATCLALNVKKCVAIIHRPEQFEKVEVLFLQLMPQWADFVFILASKYLGVIIGPRALDQMWIE